MDLVTKMRSERGSVRRRVGAGVSIPELKGKNRRRLIKRFDWLVQLPYDEQDQ